MTPPDPASGHHHRLTLSATVVALLRTRITTGVLTILPILVTLWVLKIIFFWMRDASQWVVRLLLVWQLRAEERVTSSAPKLLEKLNFDWASWVKLEQAGFPNRDAYFFDYLPWYWRLSIDVISVLLTLFLLYLVGLFAANLLGRRMIAAVERIVQRVPLIKSVYTLPKQVIETFSNGSQQQSRRPALVPFPTPETRAVGFITSVFQDAVTGEELCCVFVPTTPNPTTGFLQVFPRAVVTEVDWNAEESVRLIMSAGILKPDFITMVRNENLPPDVLQRVRAAAAPLPAAAPPGAKRWR